MPRFDPDSIPQSTRPIALNENNEYAQTGRQGLIVDFAVYRKLSLPDKERYRQDVFAFIDRTRTPDNDRSGTKQKFTELFSEADKGNLIRPYGNFATTLYFGQLAESKLNFVLLDKDARYLAENFQGINPARNTALTSMLGNANENLANYFVFYHEFGHAIYGADQAGADYIGAVMALRYVREKYPDQYQGMRNVLAMIADNRLTRGMRVSEAAENGYEPYMGIRMALAMDPERLDTLTDSQILEKAEELDLAWKQNQGLGDQQPELRVASAIREFEGLKNTANKVFKPGIAQDYREVHHLLTDMMKEENNPFARGTTEYYILKEYTDATGRIARGYNSDVNLPALQQQARLSVIQPS